MKILQVTGALDQGGVERGTLEMAAYIVSKGAKSLVASQGGRLVKQLEGEGSTHITLPLARRTPLAILYSAFRLFKLIRTEKVDLIHARSRAPAWAALIAGRLAGVKMITTFHGTHRIQNRLKWLYNSVMVRGERVIAISEFMRSHIIENYHVNPARIDVAPRGVDPAIFDPENIDAAKIRALQKDWGIDPEARVIALPGRLTRWKGQALFLEALAEIKDLSWQALLVGGAGNKTSYREELKSMTQELGIEDRVIFAGSCDDMALIYEISDLVVSASTEPEAFGRVAAEAQAMRKPVIASAHGGSLETIQDGVTGWLFINGSKDDLAMKLRYALSGHEDYEKIGQDGRAWVLSRYTVDKMCQAEWSSYEKVLALF